jgi:hypothetical protein
MLAKRNPNLIYLGGGDGPGGESGMTVVNDYQASTTITPGMLIELAADREALKWRPHNAAAGIEAPIFAIEQMEWNLGVDDPYAANDLVKAGYMRTGCFVWALVPSGQNIANGAYLQSNGDGMFKAATATTATANVARFRSLDNIGDVTVTTRCRVEVLY